MSAPTKPQERLLSMREASKLFGIPSKTLRPRLQQIHKERGNVLVLIKRYYYTTESALREILPRAFAASRSQEDRIEDLESTIEALNEKLCEARREMKAMTFRLRTLESRSANRPENRTRRNSPGDDD